MSQNKKISNKRSEIVSAYRQVFSSAPGKVVLFDLMRTCGVLKASFIQDANAVQFNEGMRAVVIRILRLLREDPKKYLERVEDLETWEGN